MDSDPQTPGNLPTDRIPARSQRQAMDWSLVLVSQGIEHIIDHAAETGWGLIVAGQDSEKSRATIRQHRIENRHWSWRKIISKDGDVFDGSVVAWVLLVSAFFWLSEQRSGIRAAGIMDGAALANGEWWRLFTATMLHADFPHLATNSVFGFIFLGLAMGRYGGGLGLLGALLCGAGGNVASWLVHGTQFHGLGASGVVTGALGLIAIQSVSRLRRNPHAIKILSGGIAGGLMLFVLMGLSPGTDVVAHFGGFVSGIAMGLMLMLGSPWLRKRGVNVMAGGMLVGLLVWTWMLALRHLA